MKITIQIKLQTTSEQDSSLLSLQKEFVKGLNQIVPIALENRCWNNVDLHKLCYSIIRVSTALKSQMVCNAIKRVCASIKARRPKKGKPTACITFKPTTSIHYDKRTYWIKDDTLLTLSTLSKPITVGMVMGDFQRDRLAQGVPKEAELVYRKGIWFFHLVLEVPDIFPLRLLHTSDVYDTILGVDLGENVLAALSSGKLFGGGALCYERDCFLALRSRLQSNGSESSKQLLRKVSGRERRHVRHVNHVISKAIIEEALALGYTAIALEKLTHIRERIKANKRMRSRLHRWAWAQLQDFIEYKAKAAGLKVVYVNPAFTSKTCADCGALGIRRKHRFECISCGILRHADLNASLNISKIALSTGNATVPVNVPNVATAQCR